MASSIKQLKVGQGTYTFDATLFGSMTPDQFVSNKVSPLVNGLISELLTKALMYQGTLEPPCNTPAAEKGDVYIVASTGTVNGIACEAGDMWICSADSTAAATLENITTINANWDIIQGNINLDLLYDEFATDDHQHNVQVDGTTSEVTHTPAGTVSQPTFSGTEEEHNHTFTGIDHNHTFTGDPVELKATFSGTSTTSTGTYKPEGTISTINHTPDGNITIQPTFPVTGETPDYTPEGTNSEAGSHSHTGKVSISYTPAGSVTISKASTGTVNYTPEGTNSNAGGHTHDITDVNISYTPSGTNSDHTGHTHNVSTSASYTPAGTVQAHTHTIPAVSVTKNTEFVTEVTCGDITGTYDNETKTLTLGHADCDVTKATAVTAVSLGGTSGSTQPTFTGTQATISASGTAATSGAHTHTFTGTAATLTQTITASEAGSHTHTFTGTGARLIGNFSGTQATLTDTNLEISTAGAHTHTFTGKGIMLPATFTGTAFSITPTFTGTSKSVSVSGTPKGSVTISVGTGTPNYTPAGTIANAKAGGTIGDTKVTPKGTVSKPTFSGTAFNHTHTFNVTKTTTTPNT